MVLFSQGDRLIVHRVKEITARGIVTQGDSNPLQDSSLLLPEDVLGLVVACWRVGRRRPISGGLRGKFDSRHLCLRHRAYTAARPFLAPLFGIAVRRGFFRPITGLLCKPKVVMFRLPDGESARLLLGSRMIGCYDLCSGRWRIDLPFRLFVDEAKLPHW